MVFIEVLFGDLSRQIIFIDISLKVLNKSEKDKQIVGLKFLFNFKNSPFIKKIFPFKFKNKLIKFIFSECINIIGAILY